VPQVILSDDSLLVFSSFNIRYPELRFAVKSVTDTVPVSRLTHLARAVRLFLEVSGTNEPNANQRGRKENGAGEMSRCLPLLAGAR